MAMDRSTTHPMLARPTADDQARLQYVVELKRRLGAYSARMKPLYERRAAPAFRRANGRDPAGVGEIAEAMVGEPLYQCWSRLSRTAQDLMWLTVAEAVTHDAPRMAAAARAVAHSPAGGSLTLDPGFTPPGDAFVTHIHGQPGGYVRDRAADDLEAGALYESGGAAFSSGVGIGGGDSKAGAVIALLERRRPGFAPLRILDLGCSAGAASTAYAHHFPPARVEAVDVGAAMLRYAHARAEHLGVAVHFHQMSAGALAFPDQTFDLVVSHNLMHEVSPPMLQAIFGEARRVLKPGGIVVHQDVPVKGRDFSDFDRFMFSWQTRNNNEPFWDDFIDADALQVMRRAGFGDGEAEQLTIPMLDGPRFWFIVLGERPASA